MKLQENIYRIQEIMGGVITEDRKEMFIKNMIDDIGIENTIKMVGNYYEIEPYLKIVDKVNFIKEKVSQLSDEFGGNGFGLVEIDEAPIFYSEDENELRQIEYLGIKQLYVDVYNDGGSHVGDLSVNYEDLPEQIIEELVEILINN